MVLAKSTNKMLAEMGLDTEFSIQKMTILLFLTQAERRSPVGRLMDPSMNLILFFIERSMIIDQLQAK